jgi:hypothetical protein
LEREKVSEMINEQPIKSSYTLWSKKVLSIRDKYSSRKKVRRKWKVERILKKEEAALTKQLKQAMSKEKVMKLKLQKKVIQHMMDKEHMMKENKRITKIVEEVKESGGVNSTRFWDVRKQLLGKEAETAEAMEDEQGTIYKRIKRR